MKKLLSMLLCVALIVTMMPGVALAADDEPDTTGTPLTIGVYWENEGIYEIAHQATPKQTFWVMCNTSDAEPLFSYKIGDGEYIQAKPGCANFNVSEPTEKTMNGAVYKAAAFTVKNDAVSGTYTISYGDASCTIDVMYKMPY